MLRHSRLRGLTSATLACLLVLYSLPPVVDAPEVAPSAQSPETDEAMLVRHHLSRLQLMQPLGELGHQWHHWREHVEATMGQLAHALTVPIAQGHIQFEHVAIDEQTSRFDLKDATVHFTAPYGVPFINAQGQYYFVPAFGDLLGKSLAYAPNQVPGHTLRYPMLNQHGKFPRDIEYHNSYFSEHPESTGARLYVADELVNGTTPQTPRLLMTGRGLNDSLHIEHAGYDFLSGYANRWNAWHTETSFTGSGSGNYGEPKWAYEGVNIAFKEHPYKRFPAISPNPFTNNATETALKRAKSLYYWETNPEYVKKLNEKLQLIYEQQGAQAFIHPHDTVTDSDGKKRLKPVNGFWVEVQPYPSKGMGDKDYPYVDPIVPALYTATPFRGLQGEQKFSKMVFHRPYVPIRTVTQSPPSSQDVNGFLNAADAATHADQHSPIADYVCVGAFAPCDPNNVELLAEIERERTKIYLSRALPGLPPEMADAASVVFSHLEQKLRDKISADLKAGGDRADEARAVLQDLIDLGIEEGIDKNTFQYSTRITQPAGEANATTKPPELFGLELQLDPVSVVSGAQYYDHYDLKVPGRGMRTDFLRTYNSDYKNDASARELLPLGYGWTHTYNQYLTQFPDGAIAYYSDHGKSTVFTLANGRYQAPAGVSLTLAKRADGSFELKDRQGEVFHFSGGLLRIATEKRYLYEDGIEPFGTKQPEMAGRLLSIADRNGNHFTLGYAVGKLTQVTDPSGRTLKFTYSGARLTQMVDIAGRTFTYRYAGDTLIEVVHPGARRQAYRYDGHLMTSHSDLNAEHAWTFGYTGDKVTSVQDPDGNRFAFSYASNKTVQTVYEPDGRAFRTEFEHANGDIVRRKDPEGTVFTYTFDRHRKTRESFNRGDRTLSTSFQYDALGNLTRFVDPSGQATEIKYGAHSQPSEVKSPTGTTAIRLDARGNMLGATDPIGRAVGFTIDEHGQLQAATDPGNHRTGLTHNGRGQLEHVDTPIGGWTSYAYNALGQVSAATDPTGTRRYEYDNKNHLHAYTDQLGRRTIFDTDANGNVTHITDPGGRLTQLNYNRRNQVVTMRDHAGAETRYVYTALGHLWKVIDANGHVTEMKRDGNGRVTRLVRANQQAKTFAYDGAGNLTAATNELGEVTRYVYDALNRATAVTDAEGQVTRMEYAWIGALTRLTNPLQQTTRFTVNAVGQVTDVLPPAGAGSTHFAYNPDGTLGRIEKPKGQTERFTYNAANQVLTVSDNRKTLQFTYDALGRVTAVGGPRGRKITFRHDALGRISSATDALGNPTEYDYWPSGELRSVRKVNGALTQFEYDAVGRITKVNAPEGRVSRMTYDKLGNLLEQTSPSGAVTAYAYDALNRLTALNEITKGARTSYAYDAADRLTAVVDANGQTTSLQYDRLGRPKQVNAPLNHRTSFEYDAVGNLLKQVDANGHGRQFAYDANNRMTRMTDPLGHQTTLEYDEIGNVVSMKRLADGATTQILYNDLNLPEEVIDALSHRTRMQYDEFGNRTATTDAKNRTTRTEYDVLNRPTAIAEPLGKTTRLAYDRVGNLDTVTNALGATSRLVYDQADRLRYLYEPLGRTTELRYNALDQVVLTRDGNGNQNTVNYDRVGRPIREMNGLGESTDFFYDRLDRLTRVTDALGHNTQYQYDERSRLTAVTDALGRQTRYRYDPIGNLLGVTDAKGRQSAFTYDALDRLVMERDPLARSTQYTYSPVGTLSQLRDGNGRVRSMSYDRLDRLTQLQTPDDLHSFAYDEVGNVTAHQNRAVRMQNRYDDLDRLVEERNVTWNKSTAFGYDVLGRMTSMTTASGRTSRYGYDELDQLRGLTDPEGHRTNYQYDRGGRMTRTDYGNGNRSLYAYDPADRMRSITHMGRGGQTLQGYNYSYDRVGNRTQVQEADGHATRFSYDPLNRLSEVNYPIAAILAERKGFLPDMATKPTTTQTQTVAQSAGTSQGSSGLPQLSSSSSGLGTSTRKVLSVQTANENGQGNGQPNEGANGNGVSQESGNGQGTGNGQGQGQAGDPDKDKNTDANGNGNANGQDKDKDKENNGNGGNNGNNGNGQGGVDKNPDANGNGNAYGHNKKKRRKKAPAAPIATAAPVVTTPGATPAPVASDEPVTADIPTPQPTAGTALTAPQGNGNGPIKNSLPPGQQGQWGAHNQPYWGDPVASVRYNYDEVGNRTSEASERGTTQYTYDEANQLKRKVYYGKRPTPAVGNSSHPHHADETTYQYDQNGNRVAETSNKAGESKQLATTRYEYDTLNRLVGIQHPENRKARYAYDPLGRMVEANRPHLPGERPVQAETRRFGYAGHSVISEWDQAGSPMAEYYHGNGELVSKRLFGRQRDFNQYGVISPSENQLYFQHDALGSVSGMSDSTGAAVMRYRQDAFGKPLSGILEPHNRQLLTEKPFDTTSGLYYFGSRWYDPGTGRFMNQDSYRGDVSDPQSLHRYAYVNNNPANLIDEWGYSPQYTHQPTYSFMERVGMRAGGMVAGFGNAVGSTLSWVNENRWQSLAIAGTVVAAAALTVVFAPAAVPAIMAMAQAGATNYATNFVASQAMGFATGVVSDAAHSISPTLGQLTDVIHQGVGIWNTLSSLDQGAQTLLSEASASGLMSMFTSKPATLSATLGNVIGLSQQANVPIPGIEQASGLASIVSMTGLIQDSTNAALASNTPPAPGQRQSLPGLLADDPTAMAPGTISSSYSFQMAALFSNQATDAGVGSPSSGDYQTIANGAESAPAIVQAALVAPGAVALAATGRVGVSAAIKVAKALRTNDEFSSEMPSSGPPTTYTRTLPNGKSVTRILTSEESKLANRASDISSTLNKNKFSVTINSPNLRVRVDLKGKTHHEKSLGKKVHTPHVQSYVKNVNPKNPNQVNWSKQPARPATKEDLRLVRKYLEREEK